MFQAGAVCCELMDNNSLFIKLIGTLSRHRRSVWGIGITLYYYISGNNITKPKMPGYMAIQI